MDYRPNIEAVIDFARRSMPKIRQQYPNARFAIVGRNPAPSVRALAGRMGVMVTGAVEDVRGWVAAADAVVAPLRIARGIQNKVLEAMAMGRPVVCSPQAAEGIDAKEGEAFVIAASAEDEADAVIRLLATPHEAAAMGRAARTRMVNRYGWNRALEPLNELLFDDAPSAR